MKGSLKVKWRGGLLPNGLFNQALAGCRRACSMGGKFV